MPNPQYCKDKCSEKIQPPPKSNSFFSNVLTAVHYLQGMECNHNGVTTDCIECYMVKHFPLDGDIRSQIVCAVNQAVRYGFLQERRKQKYFMHNAMAKIYLTEGEKERRQEFGYAKNLFISTWESCSLLPPSTCYPFTCLTPELPLCNRKRGRSYSTEGKSKRNNCPCEAKRKCKSERGGHAKRSKFSSRRKSDSDISEDEKHKKKSRSVRRKGCTTKRSRCSSHRSSDSNLSEDENKLGQNNIKREVPCCSNNKRLQLY